METKLPVAAEAEQHVIAALMHGEVIDGVKPSHFYSHANRMLVSRVLELLDDAASTTPLQLANKLDKLAELEFCGGLQYLEEIYALPVKHCRSYAKIVNETFMRRQLTGVGETLIENAAQPGNLSVSEMADDAISRLNLLLSLKEQPQSSLLKDVLTGTVERIDQLFSDHLARVKRGQRLQTQPLPLNWGDAALIIGTTHEIRSAFALRMLLDVEDQSPTLFVSEQNSSETLIMRLIAGLAGISFADLSRGAIESEDWPKVTMAIQKLANFTKQHLAYDDVTQPEFSLTAVFNRAPAPLAFTILDLMPQKEGDLLNLVSRIKPQCQNSPLIVLADIDDRLAPNRGTSCYDLVDLPIRSHVFEKIVVLDCGSESADDQREVTLRIVKNIHGARGEFKLTYNDTTCFFDDIQLHAPLPD